MYTIDIVRQLLLYGHILVFALAIAEVLHEDWRMLWATRLDIRGLEGAAQRIKWLLFLLWGTGIPLVGLSLGWDFSTLADMPKLMTKIIVASALTLNGVLLHYVAFPMLSGRTRHRRFSAAVASVLGAISTVSWLYAAFVGAARLIAPKMTMDLFLGIYATMLLGGIAVALLIMRQRVERMIAAPADQDGANEVTAFKAIEIAMAALGQAQSRLIAPRGSVFSASVEDFEAKQDAVTDTHPDRSRVVQASTASQNSVVAEVAMAG